MSTQRNQRLDELARDAAFDAVIVGGGVNGIGVFRDLSLQGLRVLLVERNDFCSGCSAAPSRMIHGGLRYLENGELGLVRESLAERDALLANAPHMVRPLPTLIPISSYFSGLFNSAISFFGWKGQPSSRGAIPIKLGLMAYDLVTRKNRVLPRHRFLSRAETKARWPALTATTKRSAIYCDAWISHPERLCIEMLRDVADTGSVALNYCDLRHFDGAYRVCDALSGNEYSVAPKTIIHATGAWLDESVAELGLPMATPPMISGTKGSHLIIDNRSLYDALAGHMVYFENTDGRVCIVFPYQGNVLAGSTDIRVEQAGRVRCETSERDYILESLHLVFPNLSFGAEDVVFSYSGIRPLPQSDHDFTGRISRGHDVRRIEGSVPQFCLIGGKWTTFRAFAEQAGDAVLRVLNRPRILSTKRRPIGGGNAFSNDPEVFIKDLVSRFEISEIRARHLLDLYGSAATEVAEECQMMGADRPIAADCQYTRNEIRLILRQEFAETLSDILLRRTALAITGAVSMEVVDALMAVITEERALSPDQSAAQKAALISELDDFHGVSTNTLIARNKEGHPQCA